MDREQLIEKIEKQRRYIDDVDAYRICDVFTELYGVKYYENITIEEELILMYDKIFNYEEYTPKVSDEKVCSNCKLTKTYGDFHMSKTGKNGFSSWCKKCTNEYSKKWRQKIKK